MYLYYANYIFFRLIATSHCILSFHGKKQFGHSAKFLLLSHGSEIPWQNVHCRLKYFFKLWTEHCNVFQSKQFPLYGFTWAACSRCAILEFLFYAAFGILNIQRLLSKHKPQVSRSNPHNTLVPGFDIFTDKQKALFFLF